MRKIRLIIAALFVMSPFAANAVVIYDNGVPDLGNYFVSDFGSGFQAADDFSLSGPTTVTDIHWWGLYVEGVAPADDFTIRIFGDVSGRPDLNPIFEFLVGDVSQNDTGDTIIGRSVFEFYVDIAPTTLVADTMYWLSIVNNTSANAWAWARSSTGGNQQYRNNDGEAWGVFGNLDFEMAFNLTNDNSVAVPEPGTLVLLSIGLFGMGLARRRQQI